MSQQPPPPPPSEGDPQYPQYPQHPQQPQPPFPQGQQPPYQQQPPQGQQPYQPYGQQYSPNPYGPGPGQPQKKNHTTRNVLIIIGVLVVLFCGGAVVGVLALVNKAGDALDTEYEGSENDPIAVEEGDGFSIRGFDYDEGWTVEPDPSLDGYVNVTGLKVTNDDRSSQSLFIVFEFLDGSETLGEIRCSSNTSVRRDRSVQMTCTSGEVPEGYDSIEVYDTSVFE